MKIVSMPTKRWADAVADLPGLETVVWDLRSAPPRSDIQFVVPPYLSSPPLQELTNLPALQVVQLPTAGYETALAHLPPSVQLANAHGVHDTSTAELALALMLAAQRDIPAAVRHQDQGRWIPIDYRPSLADRRVLIVGYGSIGQAIARRLEPFETTTTAVASRPRAGDQFVDTVHGVEELPELLPDHDIVVLVVPLTDATRHLVDADFLAAMPPDALLVNVARGGVVDTDALLAACTQGRVRAALDVTDPEPLPDGHPLLGAPGVLITPHVGGATTAFEPRILALLRAQLRQWVETGTVQHVVATGGTR